MCVCVGAKRAAMIDPVEAFSDKRVASCGHCTNAVVWHVARQPFRVPGVCHEAHGGAESTWETIDSVCSGCTTCGIIHVCGIACDSLATLKRIQQITATLGMRTHTDCPVSFEEHGSKTCTISAISATCHGAPDAFYDHGTLRLAAVRASVPQCATRRAVVAVVKSHIGAVDVPRAVSCYQTRGPSKRRRICERDTGVYTCNLRTPHGASFTEKCARVLEETLAASRTHATVGPAASPVATNAFALLAAVANVFDESPRVAGNLVVLASVALRLKKTNSRYIHEVADFIHSGPGGCGHAPARQTNPLHEVVRAVFPVFVCYVSILISTSTSGRFPTNRKLREYTIGLLYVLRKGVSAAKMYITPPMHCLDGYLPREEHAARHFSVRSKAITDTENTLKAMIRTLKVNSFKDLERLCATAR